MTLQGPAWGDFSIVGDRRELIAIDNMRLTPNQREFIHATEQRVVWRDANQVGKSWGLAYDAIQFCRGRHPVQTHRPPVRVVVAGTSVEQMEPLMWTIYKMLPAGEVDPKVGYEPGRGITGKPPRIPFVRGPGAGSLIQFVTYQQGAKRTAGMTVHRGICDEPPPEEMIGEIWPRLFRHGGSLRLGFTPTPDSPPLEYLYDLVQKGEIREINHGLTEAACWPIGAPLPWKTQAEINRYERGLLEREREMRMGRSWFAVLEGAWLTEFGDHCIQPFGWSDLPDDILLGIGIDHGAAWGKQAATLIAAADWWTPRPRVWWVSETGKEGLTLPEHDARNIKRMLDEVGVGLGDIDFFVGDVPTGSQKYEIRKSNKDLRRELAGVYHLGTEDVPSIATPRKYRRSLQDGMRTLNAIFGRGDGIVNPRCQNFIQGCRTFDGHPRHPHKDPVDSGRYPVEHVTRIPYASVGSLVR